MAAGGSVEPARPGDRAIGAGEPLAHGGPEEGLPTERGRLTDTVTARSWWRARPSLKRVPAPSPFTEAAAPPASCISQENC